MNLAEACFTETTANIKENAGSSAAATIPDLPVETAGDSRVVTASQT
jgi:hypothetical protein